MSTGSQNGSMLLFSVGPFRFCVDALEVEAVIEGQPASSIPLTPASVEGVFIYRERVAGVINLRRKFGLEDLPAGNMSQMLVTLRDTEYVAYRVDEVSDLVSGAEISWEAPGEEQAGEFFRFGTHQDQIVIRVELTALGTMDESRGIPESLRRFVEYSGTENSSRRIESVGGQPDDAAAEQSAAGAAFRSTPLTDRLTETVAVSGEPFCGSPELRLQDEESSEETRSFSSREHRKTPNSATFRRSDYASRPATPPSGRSKPLPAGGKYFQEPSAAAPPLRSLRPPREPKERQGIGIKVGAALAVILALAGLIGLLTTSRPGDTVSPVSKEHFARSVGHPAPGEGATKSASLTMQETKARRTTASGMPVEPSGTSGPAEGERESFAGMETEKEIQVQSGTPPDKPGEGPEAEPAETGEILRVDTKDFTMTVERPDPAETRNRSRTGQTTGEDPTRAANSPETKAPTTTADSTPGAETIIHIVKKGDTLWDIAAHYLGNPYRYPELAHLSHIRDPHWIYPGDRVRIIPKTSLAYQSDS